MEVTLGNSWHKRHHSQLYAIHNQWVKAGPQLTWVEWGGVQSQGPSRFSGWAHSTVGWVSEA